MISFMHAKTIQTLCRNDHIDFSKRYEILNYKAITTFLCLNMSKTFPQEYTKHLKVLLLKTFIVKHLIST